LKKVETVNKFWAEGLQFECQGSAKCCVSHGDYGYVWLTKTDRAALAKHLGITFDEFTTQYCEIKDGIYKLKESKNNDCIFLKEKRCGVYEGRPMQCRTWPFWPEVMNARRWNKDVKSFCPGVGKGKVWTPKEIEEQLNMQAASEKNYGS
jgi:uncharacterized protein